MTGALARETPGASTTGSAGSRTLTGFETDESSSSKGSLGRVSRKRRPSLQAAVNPKGTVSRSSLHPSGSVGKSERGRTPSGQAPIVPVVDSSRDGTSSGSNNNKGERSDRRGAEERTASGANTSNGGMKREQADSSKTMLLRRQATRFLAMNNSATKASLDIFTAHTKPIEHKLPGLK